MKKIEVVGINENEKWDKIVKSFKEYDVHYLNNYVKAFQFHGEGEPFLFYFSDIDCRAMNIFMTRDIALLPIFEDNLPIEKWFDLSTPYGYGGFIVEGQNYEEVNQVFQKYCKDNNYVSEFVRFNLFNNYALNYNGTVESPTMNIVRDLNLSLEDMLMDFEHKVRKSLKKAQKEEFEVEIDYSGERLDEFLTIYYSTMEKNNANEKFFFSKEFFQLINEMRNNIVYIHILHKGKVVSTELVIYGPENCYSFLGGTMREYLKLQPNTLLKYEIIKWAKEKGLKRFVLGGGYGENDGIYKYKKSFAPNGVCKFYIGKKIINEVKYKDLVNLKSIGYSNEISLNFFPEYRSEK